MTLPLRLLGKLRNTLIILTIWMRACIILNGRYFAVVGLFWLPSIGNPMLTKHTVWNIGFGFMNYNAVEVTRVCANDSATRFKLMGASWFSETGSPFWFRHGISLGMKSFCVFTLRSLQQFFLLSGFV